MIQLARLVTWVMGIVELSVGLGALVGGAGLIVAPGGELLGMPQGLLEATPFHSYLIPGLVLLIVVGGSSFAAASFAFRGHPRTGWASLWAGAILVVWMTVQLALIGYQNPIQGVYLALGVLILLLAAVWKRFPAA